MAHEKRAALAAGVLVVGAVSGGSAVALTSYTTSTAPQVCVVTNGKIKAGTYTGTSEIVRHVDRDRAISPTITAHDHIDETASLDMTVTAGLDGSAYGTWNYHSSVSGSISTNGFNTSNATPYEVSLQDGTLAGSGVELTMTGGTGSISPQASADNGYVSFSNNPALNHVINNPLTVDSSACDQLAITVRYPFTGFTMVDFAAPPSTPAIIFGSAPQRWTGVWTQPPCSEDPSIQVNDYTREYVTSSVDDFAAKVLSSGQEIAHTESQAHPQPMLDPKTNTVIQTNMTMNILISRPVWKPGTPPPSARDAQLLDKIISMTQVHENKHADIRKAAAKKFTCQMHDMTIDQVKKALNETMPCEIAKADLALDSQEGKLTGKYDSTGKLIDVQALPLTDPSKLPKLPQGCI